MFLKVNYESWVINFIYVLKWSFKKKNPTSYLRDSYYAPFYKM